MDVLRRHDATLRAAGAAWVVAAAFLATAGFVGRETTLPSGVASTTQVIGVAALVAAVLGMLRGLAVLARAVSRAGDGFGTLVLWAAVVGILLVPVLLGGYLLLPALVALVVRGRVAGADVRLPAAALLIGLVTVGFTFGWPEGLAWAPALYVVSFFAGSVEGAALIWFARRTAAIG